MNIEMFGQIAPNCKERTSLWLCLGGFLFFIFNVLVKFSFKIDYECF